MTTKRKIDLSTMSRRWNLATIIVLAASLLGASRGVAQQKDARPSERDQPGLLLAPFQTPRELLRLLDIGPSEWDKFVDGQPIAATDEEVFLKVLFRMPQIGWDDIDRWAQHPVPWTRLRTEPRPHRGEFSLFEGRVHSVHKREVRGKLAGLFSLNHYYEVQIEVDPATRVIVCTRSIPQAWKDQTRLDERCRVTGMFLKMGVVSDDGPRFMFAARRIGWLPDHLASELGIGPAQVLLGDLGMDVGLFDAVRARNGKPINAAERECFYALLHAAGRASSGALARRAIPLQLATVLQQPKRLHGDVLRLRGAVRRITRVVVNEPDIQQRYGIDGYYQLDILVPLRDEEIRITGDAKEELGPVYRNNFPFTCCTLAIPPAWEGLVGKEEANVAVVLDGFFFKLWAYSNPYVSSFDPKQRQLSPMLILHEPAPAPAAQTDDRSMGFALGAGFLFVLISIWGAVWVLGRSDRKHAGAVLQQRRESPAPVDFAHLASGDTASGDVAIADPENADE